MISTSEPNSPTARAKLSATPEMIAGVRLGSTIRLSTVSGLAPSDSAASSIETSSSISTGCTERTTNGSVTNSSASTIAARVNGDVDPDRAALPYSASSTTPGDDRRQREGQVDERVHDLLAGELVAHEHPCDRACRRRR